jgi:hypothetical protein
MAAKRTVYAVTGLLVLYFAVVPLLSSFAVHSPSWMTALLWVAAACLFFAAIRPPKRLRFAAAFGSGLVLLAFIGYPLVARLAVSLGYMHETAHLVAFSQSRIDLFRLRVEPTAWFLLLVFAVASFVLSVGTSRAA